MFSQRIIGGTLLVAGTSIGAGMLALPVVTALGGFLPAFFIYLLCWAFMSCTGLLLLELCLKLPPDANLVSMAAAYLGKPGKYFAWALYLFLFYCLTIAYISGGSGLLNDWLGGKLPLWSTELIFVFFLVPFVYAGARMVDRLNLFLMAGLIISYLAFIALGFPHVKFSQLESANWRASLFALPVIFTSFSYQGIIPSLTSYLHRDAKQIRIAILAGTSLAFLIYLLWEFLILGIVPVEGEFGLSQAKDLGQTAVAPLKYHIPNGPITAIGGAFAFFAITTSFLGVTLGLLDFLADGLTLPKKGIRKFFLALLTFAPPAAIAFLNPNLFITALIYAGGIGCALLLGLLPILMVWVARYRHSQHTSPLQLPGGKPLLSLLLIFLLLELSLEFF